MTKLADAYDLIAEGFATAAIELRSQTPQDAPGAPLPFTDEEPPTALDPWEDVPAKPVGSLSMCPAHHTEYRDGKYGPFCPNTSEDPKWSNERGYCTVTPKNAAAWLRQHA